MIGVGNYVSASPSELGNCMSADNLALEFPNWEITHAGTDGWQAVHRDGPAHQSGRAVVRVIRHPTIAGLLAAVRDLATREGR